MKVAYQPTLVPGIARAVTINFTDDGSPAKSIHMLNMGVAVVTDPASKAVTATLTQVDGDGRTISDGSGPVVESATDSASEEAAIKAAAVGLAARLIPAPRITSLDPATGPLAGGQPVVIKGANLIGVTAVSFGPNPAASFTVDSPMQITAEAPAEAAGAVDVVVEGPGGTATQKGAFTYV